MLFAEHCVDGIQAEPGAKINRYVESSLMLVTALSPHIGYDNAAKVAKKAHHEGTTLKAACLALGLLKPEEFDRYVVAEKMIGPEA